MCTCGCNLKTVNLISSIRKGGEGQPLRTDDADHQFGFRGVHSDHERVIHDVCEG